MANKIRAAVLVGASLVASVDAYATPVFTMGVANEIGFHGVANKTGGAAISVGDIMYGIVNANNIYTTLTGTSWNDNNTSSPYDNLTGYFAAKVVAVDSLVIPGPAPFGGTYTSYTFGALGASDIDPGNVFTAADKTAQTLVKFYTDTVNAYETNGTVADDISKVTDGVFWASLGFSNGGFWTASTAPIGSGTSGGINFISNNTGLNWGKVQGVGCGGCLVDMAFESSFNAIGGAWSFAITDPATVKPVPVPAAAWLLGSGLAALGMWGRRKIK